MRLCDRCGEPHHDDAQYCGTCGAPMPNSDGIAALVGEEGVSVPPPPPAPPAVAGPPTTVAPTTAQLASPMPPPVVRSLRSASIMIAALAVAGVVIIGGALFILASGSGGPDLARPGEDPALPIESPDTIAAITVDPDPSLVPPVEPLPVQTAPVETAPVETAPVETAPAPIASAPPTASPAPSSAPSSAAPPTATTPAPTTPPTAPATTAETGPTRGPGDLGLAQPILDESCDGRYVTFVGSAVGDRPYDSVVSGLLDQYPGTTYIWTKACPSLRQEFTDGADIYGVVFGPFATEQEACDARSLGPDGAYVRRISTVDPQDHTVGC